MIKQEYMKWSTWLFRCTSLSLVSLLLIVSSSFAQSRAPEPESTSQLSKISLIVTDAANRAVEDVRLEELQVIEDGSPRKILFLARDVRPAYYTIALDTSGSFRGLLVLLKISNRFDFDRNGVQEPALVSVVVEVDL